MTAVDVALRALSHPMRRLAVEMLAERDTDAGELTIAGFEAFRSMPPTVSGHLRTLREAGLVESRAVESERVYALRSPALDPLARWAAVVARSEPGRWIPFDVHG